MSQVKKSTKLMVKGLVHRDPFVRNGCLGVLEDHPHRGSAATRFVIKALNEYGEEAFECPHQLKVFPATVEAVVWLQEYLGFHFQDLEWTRIYHYVSWMVTGNTDSLPDTIDFLKKFPEFQEPQEGPLAGYALLDLAVTRLELLALTTNELSSRLMSLIRDLDPDDELFNQRLQETFLVCDQLAMKNCAERLMVFADALWMRMENEDGNPADWELGFAVYLMGKCKYRARWDDLFQLYSFEWDWLSDLTVQAQIQIADGILLRKLSHRFLSLSWLERLYLSSVYETHQFPGLESFCRKVVANEEEDVCIRSRFGSSLAQYGTPSCLKAAQELYDEHWREREFQWLGNVLYTQYVLRGIQHPRIPVIRDQLILEKQHVKRSQSKIEFGKPVFLRKEPKASLSNFEDKLHQFPRSNEPCPCGSGKKFKNCCMRNN